MINAQVRAGNRLINLSPFREESILPSLQLLRGLSPSSGRRYAPHPFTAEALRERLTDRDHYRQYIAREDDTGKILGYFILYQGWLPGDTPRFRSYGLIPEPGDMEMAPVIADHMQGKGLGTMMFQYVLGHLSESRPQFRLFLWGGVQADNYPAKSFYEKMGFRELGKFEHHGLNIDMLYQPPEQS